ncbi:ABC transporter permease [Gordonia polyisoprenivorans]|uniref:ABC transporter permease n=1 Tax=Gordonia polyisoprenivorans TaxID=84595 RepID=UPI001AD74704|nr:ABC transporter permease [Gordonia polyisoprenivorans]QTI70532.1 ABC transporter permease [Gordonia polyisoprenivorans]
MATSVVPRRRYFPTLLRPRAGYRSAGFTTVIALVGLTALILLGPILAPHDPVQPIGAANQGLLSPNALLGTDAVGRDVLTRTLYGMRTSWLAALTIVAVGLTVGAVIGAVAGAIGGWVDAVLMRTTDLFLALPGALVAIAVVAALGPSLSNTIIGISLVWWPYYARVIRGEVRALAGRPHVAAAQLAGAGRLRVITHHIAPGVVPTAVVAASLDIGNAILLLAGLSFLGLGQRQPAPELGADTATGMQQILTEWWVPVVPAVAVLVLSLIANLAGDALSKSVRSSQ